MVTNDKGKRTSIAISDQTKRRLDEIKHTGQSYDGLIQELVELWKKGHPKKEDRQSTS